MHYKSCCDFRGINVTFRDHKTRKVAHKVAVPHYVTVEKELNMQPNIVVLGLH